jgi:hypothetical protein
MSAIRKRLEAYIKDNEMFVATHIARILALPETRDIAARAMRDFPNRIAISQEEALVCLREMIDVVAETLFSIAQASFLCRVQMNPELREITTNNLKGLVNLWRSLGNNSGYLAGETRSMCPHVPAAAMMVFKNGMGILKPLGYDLEPTGAATIDLAVLLDTFKDAENGAESSIRVIEDLLVDRHAWTIQNWELDKLRRADDLVTRCNVNVPALIELIAALESTGIIPEITRVKRGREQTEMMDAESRKIQAIEAADRPGFHQRLHVYNKLKNRLECMLDNE